MNKVICLFKRLTFQKTDRFQSQSDLSHSNLSPLNCPQEQIRSIHIVESGKKLQFSTAAIPNSHYSLFTYSIHIPLLFKNNTDLFYQHTEAIHFPHLCYSESSPKSLESRMIYRSTCC